MWEVIIIFCCNLLHLEEEEREWVFGCTESGVFQPSHSDLIAQPLPEVTCYCLWASEVQPSEMYSNAFRCLTDFWCKFCLTVSLFERRRIAAFSQNYFVSFQSWWDLHNERFFIHFINCQDSSTLYLKPCLPLVIFFCWGFWVREN